MKCWIRYVLPLVMVMCLFLGSSFYSQASDAQEISTDGLGYESYFLACRDEIQKILDYKGLSINDFYYYGYYDDALGGVKVYLMDAPFVCVSHTSSSFTARIGYHDYEFLISTDCKIIKTDYHQRPSASIRTYTLDSTSFSSQDIYDGDELVFQGPSPFQRAVRIQDWAAVMMEIIIILPLLILSLTSLIGLRKGLRFVSSFLHQA